jgi:hypothetical protein
MTLIEGARNIWRRWSVWIISAQGAIALMWLALPEAWQPEVPEWGKWAIVAVMSAAAISVMPIKQKKLGGK